MTKFEKGTRIRCPSGRYAYVQYYDADDRVHVRYVQAGDTFEQACFPGRLLNQFSLAPDKKDDRPPPSTDVQHTSGKGNESPEYGFYRERAGFLRR